MVIPHFNFQKDSKSVKDLITSDNITLFTGNAICRHSTCYYDWKSIFLYRSFQFQLNQASFFKSETRECRTGKNGDIISRCILYKYYSITVMVYQGYERRETLANSIEMASRMNVIRTLISLVTMMMNAWNVTKTRYRDKLRIA